MVLFSVTLGKERFEYSCGLGCTVREVEVSSSLAPGGKKTLNVDAHLNAYFKRKGGRIESMWKKYKAGQLKLSQNMDSDGREILKIVMGYIRPTAKDFFYAILSDMRAGEMSFHDFCSEFGANEDSIKDLTLHGKCGENGRKVRSELTTAEIAQLEEELQDY